MDFAMRYNACSFGRPSPPKRNTNMMRDSEKRATSARLLGPRLLSSRCGSREKRPHQGVDGTVELQEGRQLLLSTRGRAAVRVGGSGAAPRPRRHEILQLLDRHVADLAPLRGPPLHIRSDLLLGRAPALQLHLKLLGLFAKAAVLRAVASAARGKDLAQKLDVEVAVVEDFALAALALHGLLPFGLLRRVRGAQAEHLVPPRRRRASLPELLRGDLGGRLHLHPERLVQDLERLPRVEPRPLLPIVGGAQPPIQHSPQSTVYHRPSPRLALSTRRLRIRLRYAAP